MSLSIAEIRDAGGLPSPFYRVALKALIVDDQQRLLVLLNEDGEYEIPGGGWEHDESVDDCLAREFEEEFHGRLVSHTPIEFTFQGQSSRGWHVLRLVVRAELASLDDLQPDDGMQAVKFVTRAEFDELHWAPADQNIAAFAGTIWRETKE